MISKLDPEARAYFDTLPKNLQENLTQCGSNMTTKAELEAYCRHMTEGKSGHQ